MGGDQGGRWDDKRIVGGLARVTEMIFAQADRFKIYDTGNKK